MTQEDTADGADTDVNAGVSAEDVAKEALQNTLGGGGSFALGFNPLIWLEALFKRIIDGVSGRGGVEAFCSYLDNIDFIPELVPLRQQMKTDSIFFETALAKCNKEMLKRPAAFREEEIFNLMGATCKKCRRQTTIWNMAMEHGACKCGGKYIPAYIEALQGLIAQRIYPSPEAVLMSVAYDRIANAYVDAYEAIQMVMTWTAKFFNWEQFRIEDPALRSYLDQFFLGKMTGESKIPREEKETLQFIIRANLAGVDLETAKKIILLAINSVKYGYLYQVLGADGAYTFYDETLQVFNPLYDKINTYIRQVLAVGQETKHIRITVKKTLGGYYAPCLLMPRNCWESGKIAGTIEMEPVTRFPIFPKADFGALQTVFGPIGSGKTFLLSSIFSYSILNKQELIFSPLGDKSNSFSTACLPLFSYDERTKRLLHHLTEKLGVEPAGIPLLTLTFLQEGDRITDNDKNPPTIFDRVVVIKDPKSFEIDFKEVINELKVNADRAEELELGLGYTKTKTTGLITVRNLDRYYTRQNINIDVQNAISLLQQFDAFRKSNLRQSSRVFIDEISYLASAQVTLYGSDALRSGATISDYIKESRRNKSSVDMATQLPLEVLPEIRNSATNVFFRDLAMSKDKTRSQIDFLLESLRLKEPAIRPVIKAINERGLLPKGYWFWYQAETRDINVINPCPPIFCLQDPNKTARQIFKMYEKQTGKQVLKARWDGVERITTYQADRTTQSDMFGPKR
jgi:hypothetical protein